MWESDDVNYYEHHLGDYQRKTAHLTLAEHGAYLLMLHVFYSTERPLPIDRRVLYRLVRSHSRTERAAVESVIRQFWIQTTDGFTNERGEKVLENYRKWLEQQKANGSRGGRPRKPIGSSGETEGFSQENPNQTHGGVSRARPTSHFPSSLPKEDIPTPTPSRGAGKGVSEIGPKPRRALGTNRRATGDSPRALGTNPRADRDERKAELDEARIVWSELIASGGARPKRDHRIQAALDAVGGWQAVRVRTDHDELRLQRGFCEAYNRGGEPAPKSHRRQPLDPDDSWEREEAAR
jgi:uncharacterized protein YdaU (DUF1376 family)